MRTRLVPGHFPHGFAPRFTLHWAIELRALWLVGIKVHSETKTEALLRV